MPAKKTKNNNNVGGKKRKTGVYSSPEVAATHVASSPIAVGLMDQDTTSASDGSLPHEPAKWAQDELPVEALNGVHLTSESPPTEASSYEVGTEAWPRSLTRKHHLMEGRRGSTASQFSHSRLPSVGAFPAGDMDLDPTNGLQAGERGYFFGLDGLPRRERSESVVLAGFSGGMDVHGVTKRGLDPLYRLRGLHGDVYQAKVLPWLSAQGPLVALVLHGPLLPTNEGETAGTSALSTTVKEGASVQHYQTSVEVYSLKTSARVAVLLQLPVVAIDSPVSITHGLFQAPGPSGGLTLKADAASLVVASGVSGECWIFRQVRGLNGQTPGESLEFGCVGKLWTSVQQSLRTVENADETSRSQSPPIVPRPSPFQPILALHGRWIAVCPPAPASQLALHAHVAVPVWGKGPGLAGNTAPPLPTISSTLDQPESGGMMNKLLRETTQEFIHGAKWVGKQGKQYWNSYWSKSPPTAMSPPTGSWGASYPPQSGAKFPPSHGSSPSNGSINTASKEPRLVSLVDLEELGHSASVHTLTTFHVPHGASILSFSPSGLSLFTASSKGDVQTVWCLMRMQYTKSSPLNLSTGGPSVRQIAEFSRMTVARIVDLSWTRPNGEQIAMLTERGTVHILDLPASAFTWPPPRRTTKAVASLDNDVSTSPTEGGFNSAVSLASTAIGATIGAAKPLVIASRRGSATTAVVESASHGRRVLAASISQSLGRTGNAIKEFRQNADNRFSLPATTTPRANCLAWITTKRGHILYAAVNGHVRSFISRGKDRRRYSRGSEYQDFTLPALPDDMVPMTVRRLLTGDDDMYLSEGEMDAGTVTLEGRPAEAPVTISRPHAEASIPQAEIESSAPYQPFHTDRRVALFEYSAKASAPFVFGQPISSTRLDLGHADASDPRALPESAMERVLDGGDEHIVVTTRRRRGQRMDDGFFEDDCEVLDFADQRV